jgi:hypothetical protein
LGVEFVCCCLSFRTHGQFLSFCFERFLCSSAALFLRQARGQAAFAQSSTYSNTPPVWAKTCRLASEP